MKDLFKKLGYDKEDPLKIKEYSLRDYDSEIVFVLYEEQTSDEKSLQEDFLFLFDYTKKANIGKISFEGYKPKTIDLMKKIIEISVFGVYKSPLIFTEKAGSVCIIFETSKHFYNFRNHWEKKFEKQIEKMGFEKSDFSFEVKDNKIDVQKKREEVIDVDIPNEQYSGGSFSKKYEHREMSISAIPMTKERVEETDFGVLIFGEVFKNSVKDLGEKKIYEVGVFDEEDSIICKKFSSENYLDEVEEGDKVKVSGKAKYDDFINEVVIFIDSLSVIGKKEKERKEYKGEKRIELSAHTRFSVQQGLPSAEEYKLALEEKGIDKIGFVDIENTQSFPEIEKNIGQKAIYGTKFNVYSEQKDKIIFGSENEYENIVSVDIETTGFSAVYDDVIEIGAVKINQSGETEEFNRLIKLSGNRTLSQKIIDLTGITKKDLKNDGVDFKDGVKDFLEFVGEGSLLIAQNAEFDIPFLKYKIKKVLNVDYDPDYLDTLAMAKVAFKGEMKRFNLSALSKKSGVSLENAHRATDDARATLEVFEYMKSKMEKEEIVPEKVGKHSNIYVEGRFSGKNNNEWFESVREKLSIQKYKKIEQKRGFKVLFTLLFESGKEAEKFFQEIYKKTIKVLNVYVKNKNYNKNMLELNEELKDGSNVREYGQLTVLAKNQQGIKEMFKLVSESNEKLVNGKPLLKDTRLFETTENLLIGSGGAGGLFKVYYEKGEERGEELLKNIDYLEVSPTESYSTIVDDFYDKFGIKKTLIKMIKDAEGKGKTIVATSSPYYINKSDKKNWEFYIDTPRLGGGFHPYSKCKEKGEHYLRDPKELMEGLKEYISEQKAKEYVFENPKKLISDFESVEIIKKGLFAPKDDFMKKKGIESVLIEFKRIINKELIENYEDGNGGYPDFIKERVKKEMRSIIKNGFEGIYYISYELVKNSNEEGFVVGSRGSVGSSFIAYLMGITEINPLPPHRKCNQCNHFEFDKTKKSGFDLEEKKCDSCGGVMKGDGHDIPFETFLGFKGDKVPDIDLNFSGEYQGRAHNFSREVFGKDKAFRAGTISTFAEKNAIGVVKSYYEKRGISKRNAEIQREAKKLEGVKRTTGQHPGGIIIVPKDMEIEDFTPVQYPANKKGDWKTTHFDFHAIHDNLLKLDILGHDDPTTIKVLMDYLKEEENPPFETPQEIPVNDPNILELFQKDEPMTNGVPEFGTPFVQDMLRDTRPKSFDELVKISGLSHGTDVWLNNAKELVAGSVGDKIEFEKVIGCRDDIMVYLMKKGMKEYDAFEIMEFVRKGKPSKEIEKWNKMKKKLKENGIEGWYIWSLEKIKYMFPKAHAAAYVLSALRIAWFKVNRPLYFYSAFFAVRAKNFDVNTMVKGENSIKERIEEIENDKNASDVDKAKVPILKVAKDAWQQNVRIEKPDINYSDVNTFKINKERKSLIASLTSVDGLGESVAEDIMSERKKNGPFKDLEDLKKRTKANKRHIEELKNF